MQFGTDIQNDVSTVSKGTPLSSLTAQILASSDPTKWTGEGFGSAQANAADMAKILGAAGITNINQLGVRNVTQGGESYESEGQTFTTPKYTVQQYYNKDTGQAVTPGYDRAGGNIFSGTFAGSGSTGYGVQFDAQGNPHFYTQYGGSTSDAATIAPILGFAAAAFGVPALIGEFLAPAASAATQAAVGGAVLGGGTSALAGNDPITGALLGGVGGYLGSELANTATNTNSDFFPIGGTSGTTLTPAAIESGLGTAGYGVNAAANTSGLFNPALIGSGANLGTDALNAGITTPTQISTDLGAGGGNVGNVNDVKTPTTKGYYDEVTGKFIEDPNGPLQGPLTNDTSGTNLNSMNNYSYDPNTGKWTMPDGSVVDTMLPNQPVTTGSDLFKTPLKPTTGDPTGILGSIGTGSVLGDLALVNGVTGLVNTALTKDTINNALNTQTQAAQTAGSTLKDIYNQQLGFVQPYQQVGQQGLNAITANMPYLQHQFNAQDLAAGLAPNYDFMLQQGQMANQRAANVGGGAIGGNALQGLNKFTQDYAGNAYQNAFNNYQTQRNNIYNTLSNIAGFGQTANQQAIGAGTSYGQQQTNLTTGLAAAQAGANVAQNQNTTNLLGNLANNVTLASLLGQKQSVVPVP